MEAATGSALDVTSSRRRRWRGPGGAPRLASTGDPSARVVTAREGPGPCPGAASVNGSARLPVCDQYGAVSDPQLLGRSVVVRPGQPAPAAWDGCERLRVGKVDPATADVVGAAWRTRTSLVIELVPGLGLDQPGQPPAESVTGLQPWEWDLDLDLVGERLHHAVWANAVDGRDGPPRYHWADQAVALGARIDGSGQADVLLPDGQPAICDGGPLDASLASRVGIAALHRVGLEHRSLTPIRNPGPSGVALAPDQLAAVGEARAGARVIAPAGSGKTRVLTERARLLHTGWGVPPDAMALVAYNVRAASEMRSRLGELPALRIRTLNALSLRLCGRRVTVEEPEVRRMLSGLVDLPRRAEADPVAPWIEALSRVRLGLADPDGVEEEVGDVSGLAGVARQYRDSLRERDAADFDEQVTSAIERLLADPAVPQAQPALRPGSAGRRVPGPDTGSYAPDPPPLRARRGGIRGWRRRPDDLWVRGCHAEMVGRLRSLVPRVGRSSTGGELSLPGARGPGREPSPDAQLGQGGQDDTGLQGGRGRTPGGARRWQTARPRLPWPE